ncbi:MAG: hypothetical protein KF808_05760 [Cryobacterium sp.]|nr:hypothetical protein [Cryobacterium sp.]
MSDNGSESKEIDAKQVPESEKVPAKSMVTLPKWVLYAVGGAILAIIVVAVTVFSVNSVGAAEKQAKIDKAKAAAAKELETRHKTLFQSALDSCAASNSFAGTAEVRDGGKGLLLDSDGGDDFTIYLAWTQQKCILGKLGASETILDRIGQTRPLDGTQEAEWDDLSMHWTYSKDSGIDIVIDFKQ